MDIADNAEAVEELQRSIALKHRKITPVKQGVCNFCDAIVMVGSFCDSDCRDDYEQMQRFKARK